MGYPKAKKATLHLSNGRTLTILSNLNGENVKGVLFNGMPIDGYTIPVQALLQGGEIEFV